jgi:PhzF family phenazine biosynthesis protein
MKFWQVDSFTDQLFKGNPAAVFIAERELPVDLMKNIAMEMNLAETAFVTLGEKNHNLRWFTPTTEVDLCGHATLAAAHILWEQGFVDDPEIAFTSRSGILKVTRQGELYTLDFPTQAPTEKTEDVALIAEILGFTPLYIGTNGNDCMAVVADADFIAGYQPDLEKITRLAERSLLITARDPSQKVDYIYRAFFPAMGIPEDPVTGSANTILAPYWAEQLGKKELTAYQASARGGSLALRTTLERTYITGAAVTVFEGQLRL